MVEPGVEVEAVEVPGATDVVAGMHSASLGASPAASGRPEPAPDKKDKEIMFLMFDNVRFKMPVVRRWYWNKRHHILCPAQQLAA